ncbi:MAG: (Fe-S)-binding protein [Spirochaetes bacterium]|nr:(Fe-S)-binding protein [Spirochaetota bacterium]
MKRPPEEGRPWFRRDRCRVCGACLEACPVVRLPRDAARRDRRAALDGPFGASLSLSLCTTCNACDLVCPEGADPYELVLERFNDEEREKGLPGIARMVFPNEYWNIWSLLRPLMDERETADLEAWESGLGKKHRAVLLTGFYTNIVPFLLRGTIFEGSGLAVAGSEGLWGCGGDSNKLGLIGITERVVALLERQFRAMGVKKVVCFMEAEAAMLAEVLPRRYGARFSFTAVPLDSWLLDRIASGKIRVTRPLGLTVTVHDNCMSRCLGGGPQEVMRDLAERCGCRLVEMAHARENALCCGWAATIPSLHAGRGLPGIFLYMMHSLLRRLDEGVATGADAVVTGCPACYIFMSLIRLLANRRIMVYHTTEIVRMAAGEEYASRGEERCRDLLAAVALLAWQWAVSPGFRGRFHPRPPDPRKISPLPVLDERDARRIRKIRSVIGSPLVSSRPARVLIGWTVRAAAALYGRWIALRRRRYILTSRLRATAADRCDGATKGR